MLFYGVFSLILSRCLRRSHFSAGIASRDAEKKRLCLSRGISLLTVPFWWNGQLSSLASSLLELRPDLNSYIDKRMISHPIPTQFPDRYKGIVFQFSYLTFSSLRESGSGRLHESKCEELRDDGKVPWHPSVSSSFLGSLLLERYFDGHVLRSTSTKQVLTLPSHLSNQLPAVPFEAELCSKDGSLSTVLNRLLRNEWEEIPAPSFKIRHEKSHETIPFVLKVFDSADPTNFHLEYAARLDYLRQRIEAWLVCITTLYIPSLDWIQVVEPHPVVSQDHVDAYVHHVMERGGEGLIFRNPSAKYHEMGSFLKLVVCGSGVNGWAIDDVKPKRRFGLTSSIAHPFTPWWVVWLIPFRSRKSTVMWSLPAPTLFSSTQFWSSIHLLVQCWRKFLFHRVWSEGKLWCDQDQAQCVSFKFCLVYWIVDRELLHGSTKAMISGPWKGSRGRQCCTTDSSFLCLEVQAQEEAAESVARTLKKVLLKLCSNFKDRRLNILVVQWFVYNPPAWPI